VRVLRGITPLFWLANMIVALVFAAAVWMHGAFVGGMDIVSTCATRGQPWDTEYSRQNRRDSAGFFPLHNECNAGYDLVPVWLNPAVAFLALLALAFAAACLVSLTLRLRRRSPRLKGNSQQRRG